MSRYRSRNIQASRNAACLIGLLVVGAALSTVNPVFADTGKLLLTGGVSTIEGSAGGGLSPWAMIGSNATAGEIGGSAYVTRAVTQDYALTGYGAAVGLHDRVELSLARQDFHAAPALALNGIAPFGVAPGQHVRMDVLGLKLKVAGDAVLDSDSWMPQIAVGLQYKNVNPGSIGSVLRFLGAKTDGVDLYISATKLLLAQSLLVNGTLRSTNANQNGLLGFGSGAPGRNSRSLQPEFSVALLLGKNIALGAEYRFKPNNLEARGAAAGLGTALREQDWKDIFIAWAPGKNLSLTLAWVDLGQVLPGITGNRGQTGYYLSGQFAF
jgi:hypothetical protein